MAKTKKTPGKFPLFQHANGQWAKKIAKRLRYFGRGTKDEALAEYLRQKPFIDRGENPPPKGWVSAATPEAYTVGEAVAAFLKAKREAVENSELTPRSLKDYELSCGGITRRFGSTRPVLAITAEEWGAFRQALAAKTTLQSLGYEMQRVRSVFKFALDGENINRAPRYGVLFKRPAAKTLRIERGKKPKKLFTRQEVSAMLSTLAKPVEGETGRTRRKRQALTAMILLALNGGLGNGDLVALPKRAVDLEGGWIDFPRPKTGMERRFPLWPETVEALKLVFADRPTTDNPELVFVTTRGSSWGDGLTRTPISLLFGRLLKDLKLQKNGRGFYALRHTFRTVAGEARDVEATTFIMGHVRTDMGAVYTEGYSDERLRRVVEVVRGWLLGVAQTSSPSLGLDGTPAGEKR